MQKLGVGIKERIHDMLFLFHMFLTLFKPIAFPFDVDNGAMMQNTVEDSRSDSDISEDIIPLREGLI